MSFSPSLLDASELDPTSLAALLDAHRVVVVRHLSDLTRLRAIMRVLSDEVLGSSAQFEVVGAPPTRGRRWRSDLSFLEAPPVVAGALLATRAREPEQTRWIDAVAAYDRLPQSLRVVVGDLRALHQFSADGGRSTFQAIHPVVTVDPRSGHRALFIGHDVRRFIGLSADDSDELLGELTRHVLDADHVTSIPWSNGDALVWDNAATVHETFEAYGGWVTTVAFAGRVPTGLDGSTGRARHGDMRLLDSLVG
jgi:alpha-ketoglutarate-dependent taurine dioxygenase